MFFRRPFDYLTRVELTTAAYCLRLSHQANKLPKTVPDTECQTQATAVATAIWRYPEEFGAQTRGETGVLYADFDSDGAFLAVFIPVSAPL